MESENGLPEQPVELPLELQRLKGWALSGMASPDPRVVTEEEQDRIADGEPYCFRCGKPANSFTEYVMGAEAEGLLTAWQYVLNEEGTYNPDTNRFACDGCYIAIGMPAGPNGWQAP